MLGSLLGTKSTQAEDERGSCSFVAEGAVFLPFVCCCLGGSVLFEREAKGKVRCSGGKAVYGRGTLSLLGGSLLDRTDSLKHNTCAKGEPRSVVLHKGSPSTKKQLEAPLKGSCF